MTEAWREAWLAGTVVTWLWILLSVVHERLSGKTAGSGKPGRVAKVTYAARQLIRDWY